MRILGIVIALVMIAGGGFLAFAGMGYIGSSSSTSQTWATVGSLLAGLGVALIITTVRGPQRPDH